MKKYLKTPEEAIKALKEGKEVKNKINWSYKLIDGFIAVFYRGGSCFEINPLIRSNEELYIEEADPLKIEVGKFYKTKNNNKAYVYLDYGNGLFRAVCDGYTNSYCIDDKGEYTNYPKVDKLNLVSPWEE